MTYTHTSWVISVCAVAAPPIAFAREHIRVAPALRRAVCFVAEDFFAHAALEIINRCICDADAFCDAADVARAYEGASVKLCLQKERDMISSSRLVLDIC
jgi:hypothetical protein